MKQSSGADKYRRIKKTIDIKAKSRGQQEYIDSIEDYELTICDGPAGSGKSFISISMALKLYQESNGKYRKIIIVRPAIQACNEDLGYLPGDISEKMHPYMGPILDAMGVVLDEGSNQTLFDHGVIEVMPIAFMRGRTFRDAIVIFDESQNSTVEQMKLFLTRIGVNCKVIVEGDVTQSDLPGQLKKANGLQDALNRLEGVEGVNIVELQPIDIVRSDLVSRILERYDS